MEKLYYEDIYYLNFEATVTECIRAEASTDFLIVLDRTAFFPEEGGQFADTGTLNDMPVLDVQIKQDIIYHRLAESIPVGTTVKGQVDWERRFDFMQQHSGEHIVSGLLHKYYGCTNTGFHLGLSETTMDFDKVLTLEQLRAIEQEANLVPENIRKELSKNVTLIEIDMVRELSPFHDFRSTLKLRKLLKQLNPDIIHLHSSKAGVLGRFANSLLFSNKKKVFYTPHGYSFLRQDISSSKRKLFRCIEKYTQRLFGGITIACGDTEYEIAQNLGPSLLVRNGISIEDTEQLYHKTHNNKPTIGTIGRIMAQKNPKLFNDIALRFPQYDFVWIGDGEDRDLLTAPNIKITGWFTDNSEVFPLLNQLDIYLQTSLWEGLPIAILEAMACKKPIVATDVIGNKDLVIENENGFLFQEISQLDAVFSQLENESFRDRLGEKSFEFCNEKFNSEKNFQKLVEIYKDHL